MEWMLIVCSYHIRLTVFVILKVPVCVPMQMEAAKKTYHMACKEEKLAATREANGKTEASVTPDQQKKLHEKVDKCKHDAQKVRERRSKTTEES